MLECHTLPLYGGLWNITRFFDSTSCSDVRRAHMKQALKVLFHFSSFLLVSKYYLLLITCSWNALTLGVKWLRLYLDFFLGAWVHGSPSLDLSHPQEAFREPFLDKTKTRWWFQIIVLNVHPNLAKWSNFDDHIFQPGWFNHQLEKSRCEQTSTLAFPAGN